MKQEKRPVFAGATRPMRPGTAVSALIGYTETPHQVLVVDRPGFEPETPCLQGRRSTWLSYAALKEKRATRLPLGRKSERTRLSEARIAHVACLVKGAP